MLEELVDVWNQNLLADPISPSRLESRVLLDPNYRKEFCLVAREESRVIGFALGMCGEGIHFPGNLAGKRAWILALAVEHAYRRRGVGAALMRELENRFKTANRRDIWIASYPTAYIVPGIDAQAYPQALPFFRACEYITAYQAMAMDASLWPAQFPEYLKAKEKDLADQGFAFHSYGVQWLSALREFLRTQVPWDWERLALHSLGKIATGSFSSEQLLLVSFEDRVVGYCQYEGEHFGPFGVAEGFRGRGIGTVLLAQALRAMVRQGLHSAWLLWAGEEAAILYERFGFRISRRFTILHKEI
jgi:ribosomal protein S18 acetylase RimI-like enzyme